MTLRRRMKASWSAGKPFGPQYESPAACRRGGMSTDGNFHPSSSNQCGAMGFGYIPRNLPAKSPTTIV